MIPLLILALTMLTLGANEYTGAFYGGLPQNLNCFS